MLIISYHYDFPYREKMSYSSYWVPFFKKLYGTNIPMILKISGNICPNMVV